ncbi:MAG: DeoR/GlpR family DNA-binding transcription regulator [Lachnospiraceae bacterium]
MIRGERLNNMAAYVNEQQYVSVDDLVNKFNISKATVRRDLDILNEKGVICLFRGGAGGIQQVEKELLYDEKLNSNREEKRRIGQYASSVIKEGQTIFVDTGVTTGEMIPFLLEQKDIHIVTNDVWIVANLASNMDIKVSVPGGDVRRGFYTICGSETEQFLSNLYVDIAFISIDAIDDKFGCSITNNDEVLIKQQMIAHSKKTIMLADHSKFQSVASWKTCKIEDIDMYVTGSEISKEILMQYQKYNIVMHIV